MSNNIAAVLSGSGTNPCCCNTGVCGLVYQARSGTGTLCGYAEYTSPSVPPRKYRTQTLTGYEAYCSSSQTAACPLTTFQSVSSHNYSGSNKYDASTCAQTNTQNDTVYAGSYIACGAGTFSSSNALAAAWQLANNVYALGCGPAGFCQTLTQTKNTWTSQGCNGTVLHSAMSDGTAYSQLSDEDQDIDAAKRASGSFASCTYTTPASCSSYATARGAGQFTFTFRYAQMRLNCSALSIGHFYTISIDLVSRTQGTSNAFTYYGSITVQFTATDTTYNGSNGAVWIDIPMQDGLEIAADSCAIVS